MHDILCCTVGKYGDKKTTAVNKECTLNLIFQKGSNTHLQLSDGFSPAVKIRFL